MGYSKSSGGARILATSAFVFAALLAYQSWQLPELRDSAAQQWPKAEEQDKAEVEGHRFTPKELGYTDDIMESDLLKPAPLFAQEAADMGLQFQFMAKGFNHEGALAIGLHNSNAEGSIAVELPAGMLLAPKENRDLQNLVLRDAVSLNLKAGETATVQQWAFCGNQYHVPPVSEMRPTGWILDATPCQQCIWRATLPYETAVRATEGNWMAAKLGAAVMA